VSEFHEVFPLRRSPVTTSVALVSRKAQVVVATGGVDCAAL
jgi:hypothetical protein